MAAAGRNSSSYAWRAAARFAVVFLMAANILLLTPFAAPETKAAPTRAPTASRTQSKKIPAAQKANESGTKSGAAASPEAKPKGGARPTAPSSQTGSGTAPVTPQAPTTKLAPLPPVDTSVPPPTLPRATRERMRACAEEWGKKKRASNAGLPMWRDFATGCLTR